MRLGKTHPKHAERPARIFLFIDNFKLACRCLRKHFSDGNRELADNPVPVQQIKRAVRYINDNAVMRHDRQLLFDQHMHLRQLPVWVFGVALLPLTLQAASEFKKLNPKVRISASAAGSVTGPQSVRKGIADIGACDWDASVDVPGFKKFDGQVANKVAVIPFAAIVNKNTGVTGLTTKQLQDIFSGKVKNWKDVGGKDADIVVVNRAFGSGTRVNFQMKALKGADFMTKGDNYKEVKSSGDMKMAVETTPNSIGYIDLVYVTDKMNA